MSISFSEPAPTLGVNDETGDWVITANITRVVKHNKGSTVYVKSDSSAGSDQMIISSVNSPLNPSELRERLFLC